MQYFNGLLVSMDDLYKAWQFQELIHDIYKAQDDSDVQVVTDALFKLHQKFFTRTYGREEKAQPARCHNAECAIIE